MINIGVRVKKIALAGAVFGFALFGLRLFGAQAVFIEPPIITEAIRTESGSVKPVIKGLTDGGTLVNIYIDGVYNGKTVLLPLGAQREAFAYEPFLSLGQGKHMVWAIAEDESGAKSAPSDIFVFEIQEDVPAPVLYTPVVNENTTYDRPFIVGAARNDLKINIYIDNKLNGQIEAMENEPGTAAFTFKPENGLTRGEHMAYAITEDKTGRKSGWSNAVRFKVAAPMIAEAAEEESAAVEADAKEDPFQKLTERTGAEKTEAVQADENAKKKMPMNLVVFIIFLAGVVGWIVWVNKELIKEKNERSKDGLAPPKQ